MTRSDVESWARRAATPMTELHHFPPPDTFPRLVFLGETNHFIHEKTAFRIDWIRWLARHQKIFLAEEFGWADGRRVSRFLFDGNDSALSRAATFGGREHEREDRDDRPKGVFAGSDYPHAAMLAEHARLFRNLRNVDGIVGYMGFDMDAPGGAYHDLRISAPEISDRLTRVPGESLIEEADRMERLLPAIPHDADIAREDLQSLVESLRYTDMVQHAADYEAVRPALAYREVSMKRRISDLIARLPNDVTLVLMAHAFHLARHDAGIEQAGVGPGGDQVASTGHFLVQECGLDALSVWMIYGGGRDSQPLPDLPQKAVYPESSINRQLSCLTVPTALPIDALVKPTLHKAQVGHLYGLCVGVDLPVEADIVAYYPEVGPLQA